MRRDGSAAIAVLLLPGCASFVTRDMLAPGETPTPYMGTSADAELVFTSPSNWHWITPLALIDLPLSFAFDTLALPWARCREPDDRVEEPPARRVDGSLGDPPLIVLTATSEEEAAEMRKRWPGLVIVSTLLAEGRPGSAPFFLERE